MHFPRGYWLYEKSKHLWVSGYPIKPKLFKSPQEFGLHLIWLLSSSMDYKDCCCIHCNPTSLSKPPAGVADGAATANAPVAVSSASKALPALPQKTATAPVPAVPARGPQNPAVAVAGTDSAPVGINPPSTTSMTAQGPAYGSAQRHGHGLDKTANASQTQVQAQPDAQTQAQAHAPAGQWAFPPSFLFRAGELVWYQNGNAWRLGVIAAPGSDTFEIVPIGHAAAPQPKVDKSIKDMRPFHAFSVPAVAMPELQERIFDQIPWRNMFQFAAQDKIKYNNLVLDASKMAASKIDASYSLWSPLTEDTGAETVPYLGCFFGAERVQSGDCLRIRTAAADGGSSTDSCVLELGSVIGRKTNPGSVFFRGHIFQLAQPEDGVTKVVPEEKLPLALRDECQWRSRLVPPQPRHWVLVRENVVLEEQQVRGRFYPTHRLMPILNEAGFRAAVAEGKIDGQYPYLNNRMDGSGGYLGRRSDRKTTLGESVPREVRLVLEPFVREEA